jgi:hypothetical protein
MRAGVELQPSVPNRRRYGKTYFRITQTAETKGFEIVKKI